MIRRLRWKVVGITMLFVTLVLVGAFAAILLTARSSLEANAQQQLTKVLRSGGSDWLTPNGQGSAFPCFLVEVYSGGVVRMTGSAYYQIDEAALTAIVEACLAQQDESGVLEEFGLRYVRQTGAYAVRIAFTHISFERSTLYTLLKTCLAIGGGAAVVFFVCSYLLSGLITAPVERASNVPWELMRRTQTCSPAFCAPSSVKPMGVSAAPQAFRPSASSLTKLALAMASAAIRVTRELS